MTPDQDHLRWMDEAACAGMPAEMFFPTTRGRSYRRDLWLSAKPLDVCARCPVRDPCLEYAITHDERFGIWGGLMPHQRRRTLITRCADCRCLFKRANHQQLFCDDCRTPAARYRRNNQ